MVRSRAWNETVVENGIGGTVVVDVNIIDELTADPELIGVGALAMVDPEVTEEGPVS